ncbi:MAG: polysaccharide deacetylase family protein [Ethanoligenens sp.]
MWHFLNRKKWVCILAALTIVGLCIFSSHTPLHKKAYAKPNGVIVPIIMYHEVKTKNFHKLAISQTELASDLTYLRQEGYTTITMEDLIRYTHGQEDLPSKPIVLTFDDGYLNNYAYAYPILKQYGAKAVLSIIAKNTDDFTRVPDKNMEYAHMDWDEVREVQRAGVFEIQNHTYNLHAMGKKRFGCKKLPGESLETYTKVLTNDLTICQKVILAETGVAPTTFTYPYGNVSKESLPIIKAMGFQASLSCDYGINTLPRDPNALFVLKRVSRFHNVSLQKTLAKAMKTLS